MIERTLAFKAVSLIITSHKRQLLRAQAACPPTLFFLLISTHLKLTNLFSTYIKYNTKSI